MPASMSLLDFFDTHRPSAKRIKRFDGDVKGTPVTRDNSPSKTGSSEHDSGDALLEDIGDSKIVQDDDLPPGSQTELEAILPPVRTDKEAIEEYEASRASQTEEMSLEQRLNERKWQKGRSSIYVDAFNLALETVLNEEAHLFDEPEREVFRQWQSLNYEAQYLYVRLFLRKTSAWHRVDKLAYHADISDMSQAIADLREVHNLPRSSMPPSENPTELDIPGDWTLGESFRFAEGTEELQTVEEAASLLLLDELKDFAKEAKVQGKNKQDLVNALHQASRTQAGLTDRNNRDDYFLRKILSQTGDCIRLTPAPLRLFERVHLVYYRSTEWTEKSLTTIILAKIARRNFPQYVVSRSASIFPSREILLEFEAAIRTQFQVDNFLESNGKPANERFQKIKELSEKVYPRWRTLLKQEQHKEDSIYVSGEGAYLRRFSPAWVYTRILHKGLQALARFKEYKREYELLTDLLDQRLFHPARRGAWYQRKAILEEHYMWSVNSPNGPRDEALRKHWKRIALETCERGLQDPDCHIVYHYDLQKRIKKLERSLRVVKREQHDFGHALLSKPVERTVEGIRLEERNGLGSWVKKSDESATPTTKRGKPTMWLDEREDAGKGTKCRVEAMCLQWYQRHHGWKGYHSESGILRTLFGYLFHDILFTYVPNVFQTPFQTCPLDLHTDAFYPTRASEINHRLVQIANGDAAQIIRDVHAREADRQTCIVGIDWSFPLSDLQEIVSCFDGSALATVCKVLAQEYQQRGSGVPDLFLWHTERKEVMFVEVKSENDRLSDAQRLWIHVLLGAGIRVELCYAVAKEVRYV